MNGTRSPGDPEVIARRHLSVGWAALFVFVSLGFVLESLLAWKASSYVDVGSETRRTMWRLAHAHGTGLAVLEIAYGLTVKSVPAAADALTSTCLLLALGLIPLGFFGGGVVVHGGDPGVLVLAVPPGAVALAVGVARVARAVMRRG
jgi:hypothetical protein